MEIYDMLHKTMWFGIAAELLVNPKMCVSDYKQEINHARNELPLNSCVFCNHYECYECPLAYVDFACSNGWYHEILQESTPLHKKFYYAVRCARVGCEVEETWLPQGIECVLKLLRLKLPFEETEALQRLYPIVNSKLCLDNIYRRYYCETIKARFAELGEKEGWQNADEK